MSHHCFAVTFYMIMIGICFCHNQSNTLKIDRQEHQKNINPHYFYSVV